MFCLTLNGSVHLPTVKHVYCFPQDPGVCHKYFGFNFHFAPLELEPVVFQKQASALISRFDALIPFLPFGHTDMSMSLTSSVCFFCEFGIFLVTSGSVCLLEMSAPDVRWW